MFFQFFTLSMKTKLHFKYFKVKHMKSQNNLSNNFSRQILNKITAAFCLFLLLALMAGCSGSADTSTNTDDKKSGSDFPEHTAEEIAAFMEPKPKEILDYKTSDPKGFEEKNFKEYPLKNVRYALYEKEFTVGGEKGVVSVDVYVGSVSTKEDLNQMIDSTLLLERE